jgi:diguanylate cyclase (GGDEF)-like protein
VLSSTIGTILPTTRPVLWRAEHFFILAPAALVVVGARQRAGLPSLIRPLATAVLLIFSGTTLFDLLPYETDFLSVTGSLFAACILPIAIAAVRPRHSTADAAEWVMIGALLAFMLFEILLVGTQLASRINPAFAPVYNCLYLTGIMPIFIANGVAAILLLASDLAAQLRALAANDPLTSVLNRRGFHEAALRAISNGRRQRQPVAIAMADIDHFKSINDRYGHTAGDRTLHFISECLRRGLRGGDVVGRIGGEEFALLLVNSSAEQAGEAMERIRAEIAAGYCEDGAPVPVTASFGVAAVPLGGSSSEQMLADAFDQADQALYRSKIEGRNRTTLAA